MKFVCILFFFVLFCHSGEGAQKSQTQRNDYKIPIAGNKSEMFTSSSPDLVGVSRNTISSIETGQFCPTAKLALVLCIALDKKFEELFFFE